MGVGGTLLFPATIHSLQGSRKAVHIALLIKILLFFFYCTWDKSRIATMASKVRYYLASAWVPRLMLPMHQPQLSFCFWNTPSPLSLRSFNLPGHLWSRHGLVDNFSFPIFSPQVISSMRPSFGTPSILLSCAFL